jgi:hypothetical protein
LCCNKQKEQIVSEIKQKGETMQYEQIKVAAFCIGVQQQ